MDPMNIYHRLPFFMQNLAVTAYGYRLKMQRYGGGFNDNLRELEESQWFDEKKLEAIQSQKLQKVIAHSYANVPYYKKLFDKLGVNPQDIRAVGDLKKLPILEKRTIKEDRDGFVAKNIAKSELIPYSTGGTTGSPLVIFITKEALRYNFACGEARMKKWAEVRSGDKLATFLGKVIVPPQTKKPPFWRYNRANNQTLFSSFHMNEQNLGYYVEEYNRTKPQVIQGYVSLVYQFARYILGHNLKVHSPKAILVSSETLFDWQKRAIEKAFNARVFNGYSLAEFVAFISECEKGSLHVSPEYGVIEFEKLDGDKYEIIATTLFNYAMPLIRYRTGDIVTLSKKHDCACGRHLPLVKSIEGRSDSMIITPEGNRISSASLSLVFAAAKNIRESQIIQVKTNEIVLRIVKEKEFCDSDQKIVIEQLKARLGNGIFVKTEFVREIARTNAGKYRFIASSISQ